MIHVVTCSTTTHTDTVKSTDEWILLRKWQNIADYSLSYWNTYKCLLHHNPECSPHTKSYTRWCKFSLVFLNDMTKRMTTSNDTPLPQAFWCASWLRTVLHATVFGSFGLHFLCWAAVSPGDPYPAAQWVGKAVHSSTNSTPQLLSRSQTLNVATVPHNPTCQGHQHQESSSVHQQVPKVSPLDLQWSEDPQQQGYHTQQVHQHSKHQGQLTVSQTVILLCHSCTEKEREGRNLIVSCL